MAFPALDQAKIVWAAEILLEMDMAEFSPKLINALLQWRELIAAADMADG